LFIGNDWAEAHHDIELVDESGRRLARRRLPEGVDRLAACTRWWPITWPSTPTLTRSSWVQALIAAGATSEGTPDRQRGW
jgi:hypothetical protein